MKKILKIIGVVLMLGLLGLAIMLWIKNEPMPVMEPASSIEADALANKMLNALNYDTYKNTRFLEWSYRNGSNKYRWDKKNGKVDVRWDDLHVQLNLSRPSTSQVLKAGQMVSGSKKNKIIEKAVNNFNNDSFWLVAPYKVFDPGTKRSIVLNEDGSKSLWVEYTSGGSTPGDSYLWFVNENGFPNGFKMWVKIIPIGGVWASWDDWVVTESGAFLPKSHEMGPLTLSLGEVRAYH